MREGGVVFVSEPERVVVVVVCEGRGIKLGVGVCVERREVLGERVWRCGGKSKRKKRDDDEKMREKVDEISNERGESVWCEW